MAQLDPNRQRIQDDLRGLISGDVRCDDVFIQLYASDASIYEIKPLGVVRPRSTDDVAACLQYANQKRIPVHPRGAGTGTAGGALGPGLVLDFSKYLRRVIHADDCSVRVQPGMVHERLNAHLRQHGRTFGPDPALATTSTVGSLIAVDGAGSHWLKYGQPSRHLLGLQIVLADGEIIEVGREPLAEKSTLHQSPRKRSIIQQLEKLLRSEAERIERGQPNTVVNRAGYRLAGVLADGYLDLAGIVAGSEGTLAVITEARLKTQPLPKYRGVGLLLFDSLEKATGAVPLILPHQPSACELMDRRHLTLVREMESRFEPLVPTRTEATLLVEVDGEEPYQVRRRMAAIVELVRREKNLAFGARQAFDPPQLKLFWSLTRQPQPALYRPKGTSLPVPVIEDLAVAPELLPEFLHRLQDVLRRHEVTASLLCHAGQGQLQVRPFIDLARPNAAETMQRLAEDTYGAVFDLGGTCGAERASGISRTPHLGRQYGELHNVFRRVKEIFDPQGILNPGKVVGGGEAISQCLRPVVRPGRPSHQNQRGGDPSKMRDLLELQLNWDPAQVIDVARMCNGCGDCRSQAPQTRMCPIFRVAPSEEASPRAKANLIRAVLTGEMSLASLSSEQFKQVAELCVHCHMCPVECPAGVDIPKLMLEGKGAYVSAHGLQASDWVASHLDLVSALGSAIAPLANWALGNRQARWLMEKLLGIAQGRKLPRVSSRSFLRRAARRRLTRPTRKSGRKVAYFVDIYANYHDPQLAEAAVAVLEHNGVSVYVPAEQKQAGMAAIACGAIEHAQRLAAHNVEIFAEAVRQGYHVVATEPAVAVCLTREYPNLVDDADARLLAENSSELCGYLWRMHKMGQLQLDFNPVNATLGYHWPCRVKALGVGAPGESLLKLIPGLAVQRCDEGCSGMAGTFGLKREHYRTSLRAGRGLINRLRDPHLQAGTTECSTCKIQMEQGSVKPTIHPVKLLALAYGLMPAAASLLTTPSQELIVT